MTQKSRVQAIVLAGGFGTRLSPLTDTKPKPLVRILDKTVLENVLDSLSLCDIENITVSTHYKSDMIEKICRDGVKRIECKRELTPLGTAGGVKFCAKDGYDAYLVLSGDGFFDFDLGKILDFHNKNQADATIVTSKAEDPTEFGTVVSDKDNNIVSFVEKPSWKRVVSQNVNAGIYVLSRYAIDRIPDNTVYDFSKNLFPKLLSEGRIMKEFCADGSWCDIGSLDEYYNCNMKMAASCQNGNVYNESLQCEGIYADTVSYISPMANIVGNVSIKKSVVCSGCIVASDCDISETVVGQNTSIGKGSSVSRSILGERVSVGENCIINDGCVIGDGCRIADGSVVAKNTRMRAKTVLYREEDKMTFSNDRYIFKEDGLAVFEKSDTYEAFVKFAFCVAFSFKRSENHKVRIALGISPQAYYVKNAFVSGFERACSVIFDCGEISCDEVIYFTKSASCDVGVYLDITDAKPAVQLISAKGFAITDEDERKIIKIYAQPSDEKSMVLPDISSFKKVRVPAKELYKAHLCSFGMTLLKNAGLQGQEVCIHPENEKELSELTETLRELGGNVTIGVKQKAPVITVSGGKLQIRYDAEIYDAVHLCAIALKNAHLLGDFRVKLGENAPDILKKLSCDLADNENGIHLLDDKSLLATAVVCTMSMTAKSLKDLLCEIPSFELYTEEYIADVNRASTMERLSKLYSDTRDSSLDGIHLSLAEGKVTVIPNRAKGFKIVAEAVNMEAAKELCVKVGKAIKG